MHNIWILPFIKRFSLLLDSGYYFLFFFFWPHCVACGILVPRPGIKPTSPAVEAWSLNHWTAREILHLDSDWPAVNRTGLTFQGEI